MQLKGTLMCLFASALVLPAAHAATAMPGISGHDIGGIVTGAKGPEAGVWVIAETTDLPTKYAKVVATDDQGRFVIPELPSAHYKVWVRGYGLVDSPKAEATPGKLLSLKAVAAPSEKEAAQYYPGVYWYSMLEIPKASEFPGTGDKGNGINTRMKDQTVWIDTLKNGCQSCHALGTKGVREVPELFRKLGNGNSVSAWAHRTQAGQAMVNMALVLGGMGTEKALTLYSQWTDRIAAGELPFDKPARPQGIERNAVYTVWDWSSPKYYMHDAISTDKRHPTVNANGLIYGSPEESTDLVPTLDPVHNVAGSIRHPYADPKTPSSLTLPKGESAYWGTEPIWDGHTSNHNLIFDEKGKLWFAARIRPAANPAWCRKGSSLPAAQVAPLDESARQLSRYDPVTKKWDLIDTCFTTHHLYFDDDADNTLWTSAGPPQSGVVGWLNTKKYLETHDAAASQGWTPIIVDTNGNG